jgi:hypothetical protein
LLPRHRVGNDGQSVKAKYQSTITNQIGDVQEHGEPQGRVASGGCRGSGPRALRAVSHLLKRRGSREARCRPRSL